MPLPRASVVRIRPSVGVADRSHLGTAEFTLPNLNVVGSQSLVVRTLCVTARPSFIEAWALVR